MGREPKMKEGDGEGKEGNACKSLDFENLCSPANGARYWLGWSNIIDMYPSKNPNF